MGLLLLIVVGALVGWLTAIAFMIEQGGAIGRLVAAGIAGAVAIGLFTSNATVLGAVAAVTLLWSLLGAAIAAIAAALIARRGPAHRAIREKA